MRWRAGLILFPSFPCAFHFTSRAGASLPCGPHAGGLDGAVPPGTGAAELAGGAGRGLQRWGQQVSREALTCLASLLCSRALGAVAPFPVTFAEMMERRPLSLFLVVQGHRTARVSPFPGVQRPFLLRVVQCQQPAHSAQPLPGEGRARCGCLGPAAFVSVVSCRCWLGTNSREAPQILGSCCCGVWPWPSPQRHRASASPSPRGLWVPRIPGHRGGTADDEWPSPVLCTQWVFVSAPPPRGSG